MMNYSEVEIFLQQLADHHGVPRPKVVFNCERYCSGPKIDNQRFPCGMIACCNENLGNTINFKSGTELTKALVAHEFGHYLFHVRNPGVCQAYLNRYHETYPDCDFLAEQLGLKYLKREIVEEVPIITGSLGIWSFPILNRLIARRRLRG